LKIAPFATLPISQYGGFFSRKPVILW